jgi:hypothetical protein
MPETRYEEYVRKQGILDRLGRALLSRATTARRLRSDELYVRLVTLADEFGLPSDNFRERDPLPEYELT